jgi:hypothetical protein
MISPLPQSTAVSRTIWACLNMLLRAVPIHHNRRKPPAIRDVYLSLIPVRMPQIRIQGYRAGALNRTPPSDFLHWVTAVTPSSKADLFHDPAVLDFEESDAGELHPADCVGRQAAGKKVSEGGAGMGATALPLADNIISLRDERSRAPEIEVGQQSAEISHERLDAVATLPRFVGRVWTAQRSTTHVLVHRQTSSSDTRFFGKDQMGKTVAVFTLSNLLPLKDR